MTEYIQLTQGLLVNKLYVNGIVNSWNFIMIKCLQPRWCLGLGYGTHNPRSHSFYNNIVIPVGALRMVGIVKITKLPTNKIKNDGVTPLCDVGAVPHLLW